MERANPKVGGLVISVYCREMIPESNFTEAVFNHKGVHCQVVCNRKCVYKTD